MIFRDKKLTKAGNVAKSSNAISEIQSLGGAVASSSEAAGTLTRSETDHNSNRASNSLLKKLTRVDMRFSVRLKQAKKQRLESWASDFDSLLRDGAGLYVFAVRCLINII